MQCVGGQSRDRNEAEAARWGGVVEWCMVVAGGGAWHWCGQGLWIPWGCVRATHEVGDGGCKAGCGSGAVGKTRTIARGTTQWRLIWGLAGGGIVVVAVS